MTAKTQSTRRSFLKGGAVAAAPLAAVGATTAIAEAEHRARLARLQDEAAVRDLHQAWLRRVNTDDHAEAAKLFADPRRAGLGEKVSRIAVDHSGEPDLIRLADDGGSATGRFHCLVETETPLGRDCTLAQMAHAQGEGVVRKSERRLLRADYVKTDAGWAIDRMRLDPA